jgi:cellulose biosynthesis protein BcsQ/DNA-binding MarR family transcriptional regulator
LFVVLRKRGDIIAKKATTIAIVNQKGGTAKTTTCENLGIGLAMEGKKVLLVDVDPQGSLTISMGWQQPDELPTTLSTLMQKAMNDQPIQPGKGILHHAEGVDLIPANIELAGMEVALVNSMNREKMLKQVLDSAKREYDYILLDCTPSLGMLTVNALAAADTTLIPMQAQYLSAKGLEQLLQTIGKVRRRINPKLKIEGILLTMTDSRFLTEDMAASLPGLVTDTGKAFAAEEPVPIHVQQVINGSKVTDHHALLPTKSMAKADLAALPAGERNVLRLIAARLLCAVGEPYRYAETTMTTLCAGEEFTAKGKVVLSDGWKGIERKMLGELLGKQKETSVLPDVQEQNRCSVAGAELKEGQTSPPKHFTEDTLLHAMETASADSMPEGVERQGIGTPATRAATIEKLVQKGFLERKGNKKTKVLLPTDKGKALITVMPEEIQSPEMTADWETKLLRIERGEMEPEEFMTEIKDMISSLVNTTEARKGANALMKNKVIGVCPNCGKSVVEREKGWFCENRECRFVLWKDNAFLKRLGKRMDAHVADKLLRDGRVRLKDCKSAKGKTYNATVLLGTEVDGRSKFSLEFEGGC